MDQLQYRPSTRVYPQTRNCAQILKYYDGKVLTKTPNSRLHAAHSYVCSRLGMWLPCPPPRVSPLDNATRLHSDRGQGTPGRLGQGCFKVRASRQASKELRYGGPGTEGTKVHITAPALFAPRAPPGSPRATLLQNRIEDSDGPAEGHYTCQ